MNSILIIIILICCISIVVLSITIAKSIKKESNLKNRNNLLESQMAIKDLYIKLNETYKREIDRLNQQIKQFEEKETDELKINPTEIWNTQMEYNGIYEGKKAIIGNYDNFSANMTRKMLRNFGLSVDIVKTAKDLLDKANLYDYDIIFTNNIYQQGIDGPALLQELRKLDNFNTPVVIHTISKGQREHFIDILGFDEYLEKPIQISELDRVLKKFLT